MPKKDGLIEYTDGSKSWYKKGRFYKIRREAFTTKIGKPKDKLCLECKVINCAVTPSGIGCLKAPKRKKGRKMLEYDGIEFEKINWLDSFAVKEQQSPFIDRIDWFIRWMAKTFTYKMDRFYLLGYMRFNKN